MKKVLFPFEVNQPCYREAFVYAAKIARNLGSELVMLNAFQIDVEDTITQTRYEGLIRNNWVKVYQEVLQLHDYYLNVHARVDPEFRVKVDYRIINGIFLEEYRKVLRNEPVDLVVLPANAASETTRKLLKHLRREAINRRGISLMAIPHDHPP